MLFQRTKPLDQIIASAGRRPLRRQLGPFQLTMLGIGAIIGTGIFVLTAEAAQKAGPGMMVAFVIAGFVCAVTALCYAELAAMVPVAGSAYTYSYAVLGELVAWMVGWALILEYAVAASAVCVGWSKYAVGLAEHAFGISLPPALTQGWFDGGGVVNLPAVFIGALMTALLVRGTSQSAAINAVLVLIKLAALAMFVALTLPAMDSRNFEPFAPLGTPGIIGAAASIFFAYVGFDAISTAAEETRNPQRNLPIGLLASLVICTGFYLLVAAGVIGSVGSAPLVAPDGVPYGAGSSELAAHCAVLAQAGETPLVCSGEALAHVLRSIGHTSAGNLLGLAVFIAIPSVILTMIYGQTRIFFVMARDGLLPERLSRVHPRFHTPHVVTLLTGAGVVVGAAIFPVGKLADISNSGTLFAFLVVSLSVMLLRRRDPHRPRPFRTPLIWIVGPVSVIGCVVLFAFLPTSAKLVFPVWGAIGLVAYYGYGRRRSQLAPGAVTAPLAPPVQD